MSVQSGIRRIEGAVVRLVAFLPFTISFLLIKALHDGYRGHGIFSFQILIQMYLLAPILDLAIGQFKLNLAVRQPGWAATAVEYRILLRLWVVADLAIQLWVLGVVAEGRLGPVETIGLTVAAGLITGGTGTAVAHELMHRTSLFDRALAEILMCSISYPQFCIEHVHGHHKHVATPPDPATARLGESFYAFLRRLLPGEIRSAWAIERRRLRKLGLPAFHYRNRMLRYGAEVGILYLAAAILFGFRGLLFVTVHSALGILIVAAANYQQHYGLMRREIASGVYEPVAAHHAWNTAARFSNAFIVNLGRHSDHHLRAATPFQALRHFDEADAPALPAGMPAMVLLALVPPLWFRVMDPRVAAERARAREGATAASARRRNDEVELARDCHRLKLALDSGLITVPSARLSDQARRAIANDRIDRYGGWIVLAGLVTIVMVFSVRPIGVLAFGTLTIGIMLARRFCAERVTARRAVHWALAQPWRWPRLWRENEIELLRVRPAGTPACRSPQRDWRSYAAAEVEPARAPAA